MERRHARDSEPISLKIGCAAVGGLIGFFSYCFLSEYDALPEESLLSDTAPGIVLMSGAGVACGFGVIEASSRLKSRPKFVPLDDAMPLIAVEQERLTTWVLTEAANNRRASES